MTLGDIEDIPVGDFLTILFGVLFGLLIASWIFYKWAVNRREANDAACPLREEHVKVVACTMLQTGMAAKLSSMRVVFETRNGERVIFTVAGDENYVVGDSGVLRWQGLSIYSFRRDNNAV